MSWAARPPRTPLGAVGGAVLANLMFALPAVTWSDTRGAAGHLWLGEVVATAGLILLIFALARSGRATVAPAASAPPIRRRDSTPP